METTKLQKTLKGQYFLLLPSDLIKLVNWKEGDEVEVRSGAELSARKGDLVLRKAGI